MTNTSKTILYQSIVSASGVPVQQITNLSLTGLTTIDAYANTDAGKAYCTFSYATGTYTLNVYMDAARSKLVASGTATTSGMATISSANSSGISGTVNIVPGTVVNDNLIEAICCLSMDSDIPLDNLNMLPDYDQILGFASYHIEAFDFVKNYLQSRFSSQLWNPHYVDYAQINSGTGGYDLSRILSWRTADIREASAQYVLHLLARKQAIQPGIFLDRAKCAYEKVVALLESIDVGIDTNNTRVVRKTRALSTFKISRA